MIQIKILECSSKGDKRFSAFYAKVTIFGKFDSIENHYQLSKRFGDFVPSTWKDAKGKTPTHFEVKGKSFDLKYMSMWYDLLWVKYLDVHPELLEYAATFDDFNDIFKGKSINCQADSIRKYIKQGRSKVIEDGKDFIDLFKTK
ncbi:DarT1-associated NADAR antitoxin family protein [Brevibacillus sp. NRS-1366]|uniref:DarT1-associated NADAR antitoxin family protein n=1 Tax=Brevibacillus sp. NRS-1366 TaxID=3233899 RepID=UPI003D260832